MINMLHPDECGLKTKSTRENISQCTFTEVKNRCLLNKTKL